MLSPLAGLSLIVHLIICFLYEMALFLRGLLFGFKKYANKKTSALVRNHNERVLPAIIIGTVIVCIGGVAFFALETSYRNKPNTLDLLANALNNTEIYVAPETKDLPVHSKSPHRDNQLTPRETNGNTAIAKRR